MIIVYHTIKIMENLNEVKVKQAEDIQGEDTAAENIRLKNKIAELEQQLQNAKNYSRMLESEINDINNKYFLVQRTNTELKKKLSEAAAINS